MDFRQDPGTVLFAFGQSDDEPAVFVDEELDRPLSRIDDPVFADSGFGVEGKFLATVPASRARRKNFNQQIRSSLNPALGDVKPGRRDIEDIRLDYGVIGEVHVEWGR